MIYIATAILASSMIMICFKLFLKYKIDYFQAIIINYLFAFLMGIFNSPQSHSITNILSSNWIFAAAPLGILFFLTLLLYAPSTKAVGVALTTVCTRMVLIAPVACSFIFFGETPTTIKLIAIAMVLISFPIIFMEKGVSNIQKFSILAPLALFVTKATIDSSLKLAQYFLIDSDSEYSLFVSTIFLSALIFGLAFLTITGQVAKMQFALKNIIAGLTLGFVNYYASYLTLKALNSVDATVAYPIMYTGVILVTTLTGVYFFGEKLTRQKIVGMVIALGAIIILTVN